MRVLGYLAVCVALGALVLSAMNAAAVLRDDPAPPELAPSDVARVEPQPPSPPPGPRDWPPLFGAYVAPEPQPPEPPAPPDPADTTPAAPPIDALGYVLRGTVTVGDIEWAILSHPTGELIVKVGDTLEEGIEVSAITPLGLELRTARGREVLNFAQ